MKNYSKFGPIFLSIVFSICLAPKLFADEPGASSQTSVSNPNRSEERFFRRIIFEGSFANAGYEGDHSSRYSRPNGYSAGILFDLLGNGGMVLETGALYRQFGTTYNNGLSENDFTANYISVPLDLKYYFNGQESTSVFIKAGVMGSTLISDNTMYSTPTTQIGAKSWETDFLVGGGFKFNLSTSTDLLIEVDYSRSIDSVMNAVSLYRSDLSAALGLALNL